MASRPRSPLPVVLLAATVLTVATVGMLAGVEPFATWYYQLAWYPALLAGDAFVRLRTGHYVLLARPRRTAALFAWSVPFWLAFELLNFRMANWYYVFVPANPATRWVGITVAFATVLPAILLAERVAAAAGLGTLRVDRPGSVPEPPAGRTDREPREPTHGRGAAVRGWLPPLLQLVGVAMVGVALAWPRVFYPLIWGAVTLLLDPVVYRRDRRHSLLADLEDGRPQRILRLLFGGLAIGLVWELFNAQARGKWIYTVPGLEELKLFEMPVAGFLGFPVLALDGWAAWHALVAWGLAPAGDPATGTPDPRRRRRRPTGVRVAVAFIAILFSAAVLRGMERFTISSYSPTVTGLPGVDTGPIASTGYDAFELAEARPEDVARRAGISTRDAARAVERARLATLRGIGTANADDLVSAGITSVEDLAATDPADLVARLRGLSPDARHPARVRAWVRAAREAVPGTDPR